VASGRTAAEKFRCLAAPPANIMPLYEYRKNAENRIPVSASLKKNLVTGTAAVCEHIVRTAEQSGKRRIALDGWYGVDWEVLRTGLESAARAQGLDVEVLSSAGLFLSPEEIDAYRKPFVGEDPSFGRVNGTGMLEDIMAPEKIQACAGLLKAAEGGKKLIIVAGPGAAISALAPHYDLRGYADFTMQPMLWQMWDGRLVTFGQDAPNPGYLWKKYYYNDFYLLLRQKKSAFAAMDFYVDAVNPADLKFLPAGDYQAAIDELVKQPIKQVKITQPGPWGSYRFKEIYDEIPGLENMAWNELAGIELSILVDLDGAATINIPCQNVMQRPVQMVGEYIHKTYPDLLPLQVWLDDGYFAEPVPYERGSMPIHNHPDTAYNKRNFNEPLGRYETYYIVEAYHDAGTMMGFKEDADLEEYERLCRESNNLIAFDWQKFIRRWDTNVGDLFLIPPGTEHGHGGNQMILEMDTGPSVAGTEYSFFTYDFARHTWDDKAKSMTAPPMKMHLEHSFRNNRWRREKYVQENLRARPVVVLGDGDTRMDRYTSVPEMPFEIERFVFTKPMAHSTDGRFLQIPTLTVGKTVIIRSKTHPERQTTLDFLQACLIPAGFGDYEFISPDGRECTVVMIRLKTA
jgi:mannose-6-phosphate isomerase class I